MVKHVGGYNNETGRNFHCGPALVGRTAPMSRAPTAALINTPTLTALPTETRFIVPTALPPTTSTGVISIFYKLTPSTGYAGGFLFRAYRPQLTKVIRKTRSVWNAFFVL